MNELVACFKKPFIKSIPVEFPKSIGAYIFELEFKKIGDRNSYPLGIYRNPEGEEALFKMRDARIKDYHYYSLLNEINMYQILNKALRRLNRILPERLKNITIPKIICVVEDKNYIGMLLEYVDGQTAQDLSSEKKGKIYFLILEFLQYLGNHITDDERKKISKRTPMHYLFLYPFLVIKAIVTYPRSSSIVLLGIPIFFNAIFYMIKDGKSALTHRDLHFKNIMVSGNRLMLIDLQKCVFTEPLHDAVTTLRYWWKRDSLYLLLLEGINKKFSGRKNFSNVFRGLIVNSVTHGLTGRGYTMEMVNLWVDFLKYGISFKKN